MDIRAFFDSVPHDLMLRAVAHHTDLRWVLLYVQRWLKAPLQREDGSLVERDRGTPQGSAISPLLANMFMHYAFDAWMAREHRLILFERYCDDVIVHARSEQQARDLRDAIASRLAECGLELSEQKTRIVYCSDDDRRGSYEHTSFDFLGYTFRPRLSKKKNGGQFVNFLPAASDDASKRMRREVRRWRLHLRPDKTISDLARIFNPIIQGWINLRRALLPLGVDQGPQTHQRVSRALGPMQVQAAAALPRQGAQVPGRRVPTTARTLRPLAIRHAPRRLDDGSPVSREVHAGF